MSTHSPNGSRIRFGPFELDPAAGELRKSGTLIRLQPQPFRILQLLIEHREKVVSREEIRQFVWNDSTFVDFEHGINFSINQIRAALADNAERPRYVETLSRRGYRFIAPVTRDSLPQQVPTLREFKKYREEIAELGDGHQPAAASPASIPPKLVSRAGWTPRRLAPAVAAVLVVTAGFVAFWKYRAAFQKPKLTFDGLQISKFTDTGNVECMAISRDARYVVYAVDEAGGSSLHVRHVDTHSDVQILPADRVDFFGISFSPDDNYIYFVTNRRGTTANNLYRIPLLGGPAQLLLHDVDTAVSFLPNGNQLVFTRGLGDRNILEVRVANADGTNDRLLSGIADGDSDSQPGPAWSPDGRVVAVPVRLRAKRLRWVLDLVSVADGTVREFYSNKKGIGHPAWLPDGKTLIVPLLDQTGRGQLWALPYPQGEAVRLTNDIQNYRFHLDLAPDGRRLAALATTQSSDVWISQASVPTKAEQIAAGALPLNQLAAMPLGKMLARSTDGEMWLMNADGSQRLSFTTEHDAESPTLCGRYVVFDSFRDETINVMRVDVDGLHPVRLFVGDVGPPTCSPDGKFVIFANEFKPYEIVRLSTYGGEPTQIARSPGFEILGRLAISPDDKFIAYAFDEADEELGTKLAIIRLEGSEPLRVLKVASDVSGLRWSPDGLKLQYLLTRSRATNIWQQPLDGSEPRQLTNFPAGRIFDFQWSLDGKRLLMCRGQITTDVVLLSNLH